MARILRATPLRTEPVRDGWQLAEVPAGATRPESPARLDQEALSFSPAQVPGTVASALRAQGRFSWDDRRNFDASEFWYRVRFSTAPASAGETLRLRCEGLATLADVWLNGEHLLRSENMFLSHAVDVSRLVRSENEIAIRFASLDAALAVRRPRGRWRARLVDRQQLRWFRTTLLGRIPAWTPPAAPVGPWRAVALERYRGFVLEDARLDVRLDGGAGAVSLRLLLTGVTVPVKAAVLRVGDVRAPLTAAADERGLVLSGRLSLPSPALWWPHTHGAPASYAATALLETPAGTFEVELGPVAFRTVEADTDGDRFALRLNGVEVFCRGACFTTTDPLSPGGAPGNYGPILDQARAAGMNMLRVGGTMVYEDDAFYEGCDRRGILVWQDFMFANMDYPGTDKGFRAGVRHEADQFLSRIETNPCLAVLCGNSEIEQQAAMLGLPPNQWKQPLFEDDLAAVSRSRRPDVPYLPATPTGGALPFQVNAGVAHYYGVGAYLRPFEDARHAGVRFASECLAFANIPEDETIEAFLSDGEAPFHHPAWKRRVPRDPGSGWDFDDARDHYVRVLFGHDPVALRYADPSRALSIGRVTSAEAMARAIAEWRRADSTCRGALVWFLRDLWPGAGWGLIDANGIPKAAYYACKRVMQPVALLVSDEGLNGLWFHAINETARPIDADLRVTLYRQGDVRVAEGARRVHLPARGAAAVAGASLFDHFLDLTYAYRFGPPAFEVAVATLVEAGSGMVLGECYHVPGSLALARGELGIEAAATPGGKDRWELSVRSMRFAQAIAVEIRGFVPEDSYFHLAPGAERRVLLQARSNGARPQGLVRPLNAHGPTKVRIDS